MTFYHQALPTSALYGYTDSKNQWVDGIFTKIFRKMNTNLDEPCISYILCDGDMDQHWLENINSVMDESRQLTLANNERIPMIENCGLLFEVS